MHSTRRELVLTGAALSAASYSRVLGANDRIRLGVIGCGSRGTHVSGLFASKPDVQVTALCDVYRARIDKLRPTRTPPPSAITANFSKRAVSTQS